RGGLAQSAPDSRHRLRRSRDHGSGRLAVGAADETGRHGERRRGVSDSDKILLRRYHEEGDLQAREQLIEQYMSLVRSLARRYAYRGEQLEDLVQIGAIGLIKAIDRFDLDRGVELTTYATPNIIGEIKRHFRDKGWSVRVPRGLQELNVQLSRLVEQLTVQLGRSPTITELAKAARTRRAARRPRQRRKWNRRPRADEHRKGRVHPGAVRDRASSPGPQVGASAGRIVQRPPSQHGFRRTKGFLALTYNRGMQSSA